ncbi:ABC transporter permease [Chitinophaga nivalis]|uniref:ABC transporter permease n=1 Tax=Chitinophaga nivalis TaxID=2991709 RepID=A0ABT3IM61_9BACT|nr:ABC transporter permease [Chitinophaga nivalis]MCW3465269.1 ABC transporter permease [Chitinophaga nivalis]MCW3485039.1 ABC transporter permease [Chitinophaga nivalis]
MQRSIPKTSAVLSALLRADFITQWRNRRSFRLVLLVPVIILISWKGLVAKMGGEFVLAACITIGLTSIGLMGYSNSIARDRDRGIFQRLRVGPVSSWAIMISRIVVQIAMIFIMTLLIFVVGYTVDHIALSPLGYLFGMLISLVGGALYLSLGQVIVGPIKNPETVNTTTRLVYFVFIMVGMFGEFGILGDVVKDLVIWSPYGVVKAILAGSLQPASWNMHTSLSLLATLGYTVVFAILGIKWFRWSNK